MGRARRDIKGIVMQFNKYKFSAVAFIVACVSAFSNAAFYDVERLDNTSVSESSIATAISPNGSRITIEVLRGSVGLNYSEELPRMTDFKHYQNSFKNLKNYCLTYLSYTTCGSWAEEQWYGLKNTGEICDSEDPEQVCAGGLKKEVDAWHNGYTSNSIAWLDGNRVKLGKLTHLELYTR
ncbi:hypothetical protein [Candidatus Enterovibrio escicola]|uniref:hypothetical protein n=2 Tax=Candidatus Enterovibrio escicola TaxID=1927127 RepID=UPI001CC2646B|nr:hypothetical protein [Candidatus Enterovibrio escacola]